MIIKWSSLVGEITRPDKMSGFQIVTVFVVYFDQLSGVSAPKSWSKYFCHFQTFFFLFNPFLSKEKKKSVLLETPFSLFLINFWFISF